MFDSFIGETVCKAWDDNYLAYLAKGYSVIPLAPKQKGPKLNGWNHYCDKQMMPDYAKQFAGHNHNIGLCMGVASGIMAIDVDTDDVELIKKIETILPPSPVRKKGKKGFTTFYKYEGLNSQSFKNEKGDGIDILSHGRQTVLPNSIHPSGITYQWLTDTTILDVPKDKWPSISEHEIELLRALFKPKPKPVPKVAKIQTSYSSKEDDVRDALKYIDPDESYDLWVQIGLALRSEFGTNGATLFWEWSARGAKCDDMQTNLRKYNSFQDVRDITIATLFHHAMSRGYEKKYDWGDLVELIGDEDEQKRARDAWDAILGNSVTTRSDVEQTMLTPPGFLGKVYDWITKCSPITQPMYAIASAISFTSIIYAHKFKGNGNARSNLYVMAVGPSGSGKNTVCDLVQTLISFLPTEYQNSLIGEPKSDAGLIDALVERGGKGLCCIDEIGHYIRSMKSSGANAYTQAVGAELTKLFSCGNKVYVSPSYSGRSKKASIRIPEPCLSVFGQSVKDRVFSELKEEDFVDGFFNRWLIFESSEKMPSMNTDFIDSDSNYPHEIVNFVSDLDKWIIPLQLEVNYAKTAAGVNAISVPILPEAKQMMTEYGIEINNRRNEVGDGLFDYPLSRAAEHCSKLSLIAMEFKQTGDNVDRPVITPASVSWAIATTEHHLSQIRERLGDLTGSDYENQVMQMVKRIPMNKELSESEFANYARMWSPKQRKEMLNDLLTRGLLGWVEKEDNKKKLIRK